MRAAAGETGATRTAANSDRRIATARRLSNPRRRSDRRGPCSHETRLRLRRLRPRLLIHLSMSRRLTSRARPQAREDAGQRAPTVHEYITLKHRQGKTADARLPFDAERRHHPPVQAGAAFPRRCTATRLSGFHCPRNARARVANVASNAVRASSVRHGKVQPRGPDAMPFLGRAGPVYTGGVRRRVPVLASPAPCRGPDSGPTFSGRLTPGPP